MRLFQHVAPILNSLPQLIPANVIQDLYEISMDNAIDLYLAKLINKLSMDNASALMVSIKVQEESVSEFQHVE